MSDLIRSPKEPGWYLARPKFVSSVSSMDEPPVVVRVVPDPAGVTTVWRIGSRDPATLDEWRLVGKVHVDGSVTDLDLKEAHAAGVQQGHAEAHAQQVEYEARREREHPKFASGIRLDLWRIGQPVIAIEIPTTHAEDLSLRLSDFLCWARGFSAALPRDDYDRAPIGVEAIRDINIAMKAALARADAAKESA